MPHSTRPPRRTDHPYRAETLNDLPDGLRPLAEQSVIPGDPIETIFVVPERYLSQHWGEPGGMRRVPEQALLFTARGALHVQGENLPGQPAQATYLPGCDLLYAHLSLVLLYGRLELCGIANDALAHIVVEYNTIRHDLVQPGLQRLLRQAWGRRPPQTRRARPQRNACYRSLGSNPSNFAAD